jgi:hypothetical protein
MEYTYFDPARINKCNAQIIKIKQREGRASWAAAQGANQ